MMGKKKKKVRMHHIKAEDSGITACGLVRNNPSVEIKKGDVACPTCLEHLRIEHNSLVDRANAMARRLDQIFALATPEIPEAC